MTTRPAFIDALCAAGPASDRAERMALYGFLIGQWEIDAVYHCDDGSKIRWSFTEIAAESFHWRGERWDEAASAWRLRTRYFVRRVTAAGVEKQ
jgi:hypothetical protein